MMLKFRRFTLQSRIRMPYSLLLLVHVEVRVGEIEERFLQPGNRKRKRM